ncbi:RHS repeat-associated core domain-containing protein, partial [Salinivibrio sp. IB574]|uniref:RHS repeat-associated core domain-containing protein n=1 Tax=Salinivibrio sp. IB574 TaxID=1909444 RepID=UPI00098982AF
AHQPLDFAYTPQGQEQQRGNQQGFRLTHQWSERGLLTQQGLGQHQDPLRCYHYDALDRLIGIDDNHRGSHRFMLNPNGQVVGARQQKASQPNGRFVHLFGYDSELNLNETGFATEYSQQQHVVSLADARVQRQKRRHDRAGRVLETGRFRYRYDACGRVIEKTENKTGYRPQVTRFSWNADDRLTHIELPNGTRYRYRYDPFGRRIAKECAHSQTQTHYLWDGAHIVQQQQATADGQVLQQTEYLYEPGSFRPMAQVTHHEQGSELHYIVTDHAGTPQELCNEQGDIVWRGEQALWGHYHGQSQRHWQRREEAANDSIQCDLRYQGQIEDPESGLYYNVNRYYDADSGQYLSPDPIGFAGGLRPQAYVANPLDSVDPLGLLGEVIFPKDRVLAETTIQMQGSRNWDFKVANESVGLNGARGKPTSQAHKQALGDVVWHHADYDPETNTAKMQLVTSEDHNASKPHKGSVKAFEDATGTKYESPAAKQKAKELNKRCFNL